VRRFKRRDETRSDAVFKKKEGRGNKKRRQRRRRLFFSALSANQGKKIEGKNK
jgi:hypothetical protein